MHYWKKMFCDKSYSKRTIRVTAHEKIFMKTKTQRSLKL